MANKIQIRRDTTTNWGVSDPILSQGELGLDTTLNKMKIGNGTSHWSTLSFFIGDTGPQGNVGPQGPAGDSHLSELVNGLHTVSLGSNGDLTLADNGGIVFDRNNTSIRVGMGFHIASGEGISLEAIDQTDPENLITNGWYFSPTGGITFPTLSVDIHNGGVQSAQVLKFDNASQQVIITGPTPAAGSSAERIIIQGQRATGNGEGGDVYLWGGDSAVNGGDIKIYAGDGEASPSNGGYVNITGGNGYAYGGDVTLTAGYASQFGGNVVLSAGNAGGQDGVAGHVTINASNHSWTFGNDGKLQLPAGGDIVNNAGNSITDIYKFEYGTIGTKANPDTSNGWGGYNMYLDPGGESWASIFIPSVTNQDSGDSLQITNKGAATSIVQVIGWGGVQLVTNTGVDEKVFEFGDDGKLTLPKGGRVSETSNTIAFAPPTAAAGQSLVIRPTAGQFSISTDHPSGFVPGETITITVSTQFGSDSGELYYTITGATTEQLGRATTGTLTFSSESSKTVTWTIPAQSSMTTFTFDLTGGTGFPGPGGIYVGQLPEITVTLDGSAISENNHVHLVAGNPTTVDIYLGDDDQYVKIEKNAGDVVIGTNLDTHQWTFGTDSKLTLPNASTISPVAQVGYNYGPYASDIYNNTTGGALGGGTQTVVNIGNTVHNDLFDPPVPNVTTTTGTIASNGDFEPGTSTGTFGLHTYIIVGSQSLGALQYRDEQDPAAGFTLQLGSPYAGPVVTSGTLIQGYNGWITRTPKTTTYIKWADGSSSQVTGSSVNQYPNHIYGGLITANDVSGKSFPATLYTANYIPSGTAIGVNSNNWKFDTTGKLTLPASGTISYTPATASDWAGTPPVTLQEAIDRLAAAFKTLNTTGA